MSTGSVDKETSAFDRVRSGGRHEANTLCVYER